MSPVDLSLPFACPLPISDYPTVLLAHGGGGRLSHQLIDKVFAKAFANELLAPMHDGAVMRVPAGRIAMSTDSFVVKPLFFPGGNIGELAVCGTVNDLAMCGATPMWLTAGYILEEGLSMETLWRVASSMRQAADQAGVKIVTGDTKVVDRGKGDGIFINTAGVGLIPEGIEVAPLRMAAGDVVLLSGDIGRHGVAILSVRDGLSFESELQSDAAPLNGLVTSLLTAVGNDVHVLRDPTRGGVASALCELASAAKLGVEIHEKAIPVRDAVRGACEMLGLDPLYVANEGKLVAFVKKERADEALAALRAHPLGTEASIIGQVTAEHPGRVVMKSGMGGKRVIEMMSGEQLPRIC